MSGIINRLFRVPLNRGGFAIRFFIVVLITAMSRTAQMAQASRTVLFVVLTVYLLSITIRRCRDFNVSTGKIAMICVIMCIPVVSFVEGIYLCCKKGLSYYMQR